MRELNRHFGPIQKHPTSGNVKGYPEFHVGKCAIDLSISKNSKPTSFTVYRDAQHDRFQEYLGGDRINHTSWHSDVSYEKQPPGTTFFFILDQVRHVLGILL